MKKFIAMLLSFALILSLSGCSGEPSKDEPVPNPSDTTKTDNSSPTKDNSKILVAYFSATGTTKQAAEYAAEILNADIYEIVPEIPYTEEDLAYYTDGRADREQNNPSARPAISGSIENIEQYDTVLVGYPIWHGQAPRIISTFLESYHLQEKRLYRFAPLTAAGLVPAHLICIPSVPAQHGWKENGFPQARPKMK